MIMIFIILRQLSSLGCLHHGLRDCKLKSVTGSALHHTEKRSISASLQTDVFKSEVMITRYHGGILLHVFLTDTDTDIVGIKLNFARY